MGLDMYLNRRVDTWEMVEHPEMSEDPAARIRQREELGKRLDEKSEELRKMAGIKKTKYCQCPSSASIIYNVMCWRKAYSIDEWFYDLAENDRDEFYVSHSDLMELKDRCKKVIDSIKNGKPDEKVIQENLPICDQDLEWYMHDVRRTYAFLKTIENDNEGSYYYERSY